jgi:small GTP-binding protein
MEIPSVKVIILGDSHVGKSSIVYRFVTGNFSSSIQSTIAANYMKKQVQLPNSSVQLDIWDSAGQERYATFTRMHCRNVKSVVFVFDYSNFDSFKSMEKWKSFYMNSDVDRDAKVYVVLNKCDLAEGVQVPENMKEYAKSMNAEIFLVSALSNIGIDELFVKIAQDGSMKNTEIDHSRISIYQSKPRENLPKRGKCC